MEKLPKLWVFEEQNRARLSFSDATKIRLNPKTNQLELSPQGIEISTGSQTYPVDADLYVTAWTTNPSALRAWAGFALDPFSPDQPDNTSVGLKLNDGTNDRYWDGGAWSVAGASDWNTEAEVAANIAAFPVTSQILGLVINLQTTDKYTTPTLKAAIALMTCDLDYLRSVVADCLIPSLRDNLRPVVDFAVSSSGTAVVSIKGSPIPFNVVNIVGAFNHTDDPNHLTNIFSSWDAATEEVTLTGTVASGKMVWLDIEVEPDVGLSWGSEDYTEVAKVPAVIVESVDIRGNEEIAEFQVPNADDYTVVRRFQAFRLTLDFGVVLVAGDGRTLLQMQDQALRHSREVLTWQDLDEELNLMKVGGPGYRQRPEVGRVKAGSYSLRLSNLYFWTGDEEQGYLVQQVQTTTVVPKQEGGHRYTS